MTRIYNKYLKYSTLTADEKEELLAADPKVLDAANLFIWDGTKYINILKLYVVEFEADGVTIKSSRQVRSQDDYNAELAKNHVYTDSNGTDPVASSSTKSEVYINNVKVPSNYTSTHINIEGVKTAADPRYVPYGLKRKLSVKQQTPDKGKDAYLYVKVGDEWKFLRKTEIFWIDGADKKTYHDGGFPSNVQFIDKYGHDITAVYTEYEYIFVKISEYEKVDLKTYEKKTVSVSPAGTETDVASVEVDKFYCVQEYETRTVDDPTNPGKTMEESRIKTKSFVAAPSSGEYVSVTVGSTVKLVRLTDLVDEAGNPITDLSLMFGKRLKIMEGTGSSRSVVATTEPLTYEQAKILYDSIKTYQPVDTAPSDNSCLRLMDGTYVKEMETVQPISYKLASGSDPFDKFLIKYTSGSTVKYVIIDKATYARIGSGSAYDKTSAVKLAKCDFNDPDCAVVQTTSKGVDAEECAVVKPVSVAGTALPVSDKATIYAGFKTGYKEGNYKIESVYIEGREQKLDVGRYEYTDVSYQEDSADQLPQYKAIKTKEITLKDGRKVVKPVYDIGSATGETCKNLIAKPYKKWMKYIMWPAFLVPGPGTLVFLGFFAYIVGTAAVASIFHGIKGMHANMVGVKALSPTSKADKWFADSKLGKWFSNTKVGKWLTNLFKPKKLVDKTQYQKQEIEKNAQQKISDLMEKLKNGVINQKQFDDAYSRILLEVISLGRTSVENIFTNKDGTVKVDTTSASFVAGYLTMYNDIKKQVEAAQKKRDKAKADLEKVEAEVAKAGSSVTPALLNKLNTARANLVACETELNELQDRLDNLYKEFASKTYDSNPEFKTTYAKMEAGRIYAKISTLTGSDLTDFINDEGLAWLDLSKVSYDAEKGLMYEGVPIFADDSVLAAQSLAWKTMRSKILEHLTNETPKVVEPPLTSEVEKVAILMQQLEDEKAECEILSNQIKTDLGVIVDGYKVKTEFNTNRRSYYDKALLDYNEANTKTASADIDLCLQDLIAQKNNLQTLAAESGQVAVKISEIETAVNEFNMVAKDILLEIKNLADTEPEKVTFKDDFKNLRKLVNDAVNDVKDAVSLAQLDSYLSVIKTQKVNADALLGRVQSTVLDKDVESIVNDIVNIKTDAVNKFKELDTLRVKTSLSSSCAATSRLVDVIKLLETKGRATTSVADANELRIKAGYILRIIVSSVELFKHYEDLYSSKASASKLAEVMNYIHKMGDLTRCDETTSNADLQIAADKSEQYLEAAQEIKKTTKTETTTSKDPDLVKLGKIIARENDLRNLLIGLKPGDTLFELLKSKTGLDDKNLKAKIKYVINKIGDKHAEGKSAETGSTGNIKIIFTSSYEYMGDLSLRSVDSVEIVFGDDGYPVAVPEPEIIDSDWSPWPDEDSVD